MRGTRLPDGSSVAGGLKGGEFTDKREGTTTLLALQVYGDTGNSECHYHECEGKGIDVHGSSLLLG